MQIYLQSDREGQLPEWGLVEFQGDFDCRDGGDSIYGQYLGDCTYTKNGTLLFVIGHHVLYGQEVKLQRPFIVIRKTNEQNELAVTAVVRKKIVFKSRPKPIIADNQLPSLPS